MTDKDAYIISKRWIEAEESPTYARWHSLASMLDVLAVRAENEAPGTAKAKALRDMHNEAYANLMAIQPCGQCIMRNTTRE